MQVLHGLVYRNCSNYLAQMAHSAAAALGARARGADGVSTPVHRLQCAVSTGRPAGGAASTSGGSAMTLPHVSEYRDAVSDDTGGQSPLSTRSPASLGAVGRANAGHSQSRTTAAPIAPVSRGPGVVRGAVSTPTRFGDPFLPRRDRAVEATACLLLPCVYRSCVRVYLR